MSPAALQDAEEESGEGESLSPDRRHGRGRRSTDGVVVNAQMITAAGGLLVVVSAVLAPVAYVRDMAQQVRHISSAVDELVKHDVQTRAEVIELRSRSDESRRQRNDHEERIRELEREIQPRRN